MCCYCFTAKLSAKLMKYKTKTINSKSSASTHWPRHHHSNETCRINTVLCGSVRFTTVAFISKRHFPRDIERQYFKLPRIPRHSSANTKKSCCKDTSIEIVRFWNYFTAGGGNTKYKIFTSPRRYRLPSSMCTTRIRRCFKFYPRDDCHTSPLEKTTQ